MPMRDGGHVKGLSEEPRLEVGDLLISYLKMISVDFVFGIPGGAIEPLYNALARSEASGGPRSIVSRHESGAAFMADGYYRQTGKLGVCCATTGPGTTNLITGVASAYENHVPLLVLSAQTSLAHFGRGAFQESSCTGVNTVGMFQYCTRYNTLVSHVEQFERKLASAILTAFQTPCGPTHLSVPLDVLRAPSPVSQPSFNLPTLLHRPSLLDHDGVEALCKMIEGSRKVVMVVGDDCDEAIGTILEVAALIRAAVVCMPHGKGMVSPYHPLFRGVIGFAGHQSAAHTLTDPEVDAVIAIGTGLGEWASGCWNTETLLNKRLIHVDASESNLARSPMAKLHVRGRILTVFDRLLKHLRDHYVDDQPVLVHERRRPGSRMRDANQPEPARLFRLDDEAKYCDESTPIKPQRLMRELTRVMPPNTRYVADTGSSVAWAIHYLHPFDRRISGQRSAQGGLFRSCLEFSAMGWAIGSAIGAALAFPGGPVVCITGDGSLLMNGQEITVALSEKLTVIYVVLNDSALGMVKHGQRLAGAEPIGTELPQVDFAAFARSLGADGHTVRAPNDLLDIDFEAICERGGPTLIDVHIDPDEVPPIATRIKALEGEKS
jgi:acetolactate synthase-1/2/3 large subunit